MYIVFSLILDLTVDVLWLWY